MIFFQNFFNKKSNIDEISEVKLDILSRVSTSEYVAVKTIQFRYNLSKRNEINKKFIREIHNPFKNSKEPERLQAEMLLKGKQSVGELLLKMLGFEKKYTRPFFCAYLIAGHGEFLFGGSYKTQLESILEETAVLLLRELEAFLKNQETQTKENSLKMFLQIYFDTFFNWKNQDEPKLIEALIAEYIEQVELLYSVGWKQSRLSGYPGDNAKGESMKEWLPHVQKHQNAIRKKLKQVGGKKALDKLAKRIEELKERKEQLEDKVHTQGDHIESVQTSPIIKLENIEIVHELFLNPNFSFKELTSPVMEEVAFSLTFDKIMALDPSEKLELILLLKDSLIAICPEQEAPSIRETLEEEFVKKQIFGGSFEWPKFLDYLLDLMSRYCAPARDELIAHLKKDPTCEAIIKSLLEMKEDLSNANLMLLRETLLADPRILVGYEQNWFTERKFNYENASEWLDKGKKGLLKSGEKCLASQNAAIIQFCFVELLFSDETISGETLCLDVKRIDNWRKKIREIIDYCTDKVLKDKTESIITDNPVKNLFAKRLKENILKQISFTKDQSAREESLKKQGFESVVGELCSLLQEIVIFFEFHIKVHGVTYDKELAKLQ